MPSASKISIDQAKPDKLFYFVANVVVVRESDMRCLLLKRSMREKVHPGVFAMPGGKLEWNDLDIKHPTRMNGDVIDFENAIEDLLVRETREEAGIEIDPSLRYINSVAFVRPDGIPVILAKFAAKYVSGDIKLEEGSFDDHIWVSEEEVSKYHTIDGIPEEISAAVALFR